MGQTQSKREELLPLEKPRLLFDYPSEDHRTANKGTPQAAIRSSFGPMECETYHSGIRRKLTDDEIITLRVFYTTEKSITIDYAAAKSHALTTGWLFSEVIRKLMETDADWFLARKSNIDLIALESRKKPGQSILSTLDYWLLCYD